MSHDYYFENEWKRALVEAVNPYTVQHLMHKLGWEVSDNKNDFIFMHKNDAVIQIPCKSNNHFAANMFGTVKYISDNTGINIDTVVMSLAAAR